MSILNDLSKDTVIFISGTPCTGKTTVAEYLINNYSDRFEKVITDTTRQPREGEIDGIHYNFKTINFTLQYSCREF